MSALSYLMAAKLSSDSKMVIRPRDNKALKRRGHIYNNELEILFSPFSFGKLVMLIFFCRLWEGFVLKYQCFEVL